MSYGSARPVTHIPVEDGKKNIYFIMTSDDPKDFRVVQH